VNPGSVPVHTNQLGLGKRRWNLETIYIVALVLYVILKYCLEKKQKNPLQWKLNYRFRTISDR